MIMPRLSLYKPERGQDYRYMDKVISEMFQVGGTGVYLHKYIGPKNPETGTADQPIYDTIQPTNIQDMLFLENRDRKYDTEIYQIRGIYNVQNIDFNLSQFGLFIDSDTLFMTVHINDFIKYIGRKPISGDVIELPHLRDEFALNDYDVSLPRYYVIEDVGRASEGFSPTWYPHLYRLRIKKILDNQQFADILKTPTGADADKFVGDYDPNTPYYAGQIVRKDGQLYTVTQDTTGNAPPNTTYFDPYGGTTLEGILSTRAKELEVNASVLNQAEADAPLSGYQTEQFYTLAVDPTTGKALIETADETLLDASITSRNASITENRPLKTGYTGYLVGDGIPSNGYEFGHGIQFPESAVENDYFLRTDFLPNRLFRFNGNRWVRIEDAVRMTMTNNDFRQTLKTSFINNNNYTYTLVVGSDLVTLSEGDTVITTNIPYVDALYVSLKFNTTQIPLVVADSANILELYVDNNVDKVRINLPVINGTQLEIPADGLWEVKLANYRESERQSLSKALRPKADL